MMKWITYSFLFLLGLFLLSCEKIEEEVDLFEAEYTSKINDAQSFYYFYDDGVWVSGGLDQYMCKINTVSGTFVENNMPVLIEMFDSIPSIGDSLIPFTYFLGLKYNSQINSPFNFTINGNYQFNLPTHRNYNEYQFFKENLIDMHLYELTFESASELYEDPDFEIKEVPFVIDIDSNLIQFETQKLNAVYGFCWKENKFSDTITFQISPDGNNMNISSHQAYRKFTNEGAVYYGRDLEIDYLPTSEVNQQNSVSTGWYFRELHLDIKNPTLGIVDHENINFTCISQKTESGTYETSYIELLPNTEIRIVDWPEINEYGEIIITGIAKLVMTQSNVPINMTLKFKRLR